MDIFDFLNPLAILVIGFILTRSLTQIEDRSIAAVCLFVLVPALLFRLGLGQKIIVNKFTIILFFDIFHYAVLFFISYYAFNYFDVPARTKRIFLLSTLTASVVAIQKIVPLLGEPAETAQTINTILFFHLSFLGLLGIFLGAGNERSSENVPQIFKTPLFYLMILGLILTSVKFSVPQAVSFEIMSFIDTFNKFALPLALLIVGIMIGKYVIFLQIQEYAVLFLPLIICCFLRLVVSPLLAMLITKMMGFDEVDLQRSLIITSGTPTGELAAVIVSFYGRSNEKRFVVLCVIFTVLLSFFTLPTICSIADRWYPIAGK